MLLKIKYCLFIGLLLSSANFLSAQDENSEFNRITVGFSAVKDYLYSDLQYYWEPQVGFEGYFNTPFYFGNIQAGVTYCRYIGYTSQQPNFLSMIYYIQWEKEIYLSSPISIAFGGRIGLMDMTFDETESITEKTLLNESDLMVGIISKLNLNLPEGWTITIHGSYMTVFTSKKMEMVYAGIGLTKTFLTPDWLKEFFE
ncbi:MAG: hypothetical protein A2V66_14630 [Ignavibacteria bacterium RBG_13_36_8]|nr:MAG: hypothetical protein A2V66_14630 [Ignavibacteria bacterium RBG_13_36_8]